ncbi:MAG: phosphopyruvate hydratase [Elusimicrobia bacterium]|nr:phosphopyruvate hydratase [Elusimicrobiota bacterium]
MSRIKKIAAREILDSRGLPTVEVDVRLADGALGRASVPSGASTGKHEALELRDNDLKRYFGKGVRRAVANVCRRIAPRLIGLDAKDQQKADGAMLRLDGTANKSRLGANAILAVSLAVHRAHASSRQRPVYQTLRETYGIRERHFYMPTPLFNILNGGRHADNGLAIQEFMIVPAGARSFRQALQWGSEIYHALKKILQKRGLPTSVGDEGGFAPKLKSNEEAIQIILEAVRHCGYGRGVGIAIDAAASEFFQGGRYRLNSHSLTPSQTTEIYRAWARKYPILSLEDGLAEDDWTGWAELTRKLGNKMRLVGDDIFVTNPARLKKGVGAKIANAILIKLNQIGTLTETMETIRQAKSSGYATIISHRSGETEDAFISDLAVAVNAGAIKTGAPCRSERLAKYNQLLRIEENLGRRGRYAGKMEFA